MGSEGGSVAVGRSEEEKKALAEWLPITSSRNANWSYSAFHNVTAMVGAGVLSLPYAMSHLGWGPGICILILSWVITLYTLWQMVEMHEMPDKAPGKRFDRYHELGQEAFGEKLGLWIVVPQQLIVEVGVDIVYMVTGGKSLKKIEELVFPKSNIKLTYFIMIFASSHFILSQLPNFNSISAVSLAAAVMSLCYSIVAWTTSMGKGRLSDVSYASNGKDDAEKVFNFFTALGDVAFAYAGHNVVLEIQATLPSTPENPSKKAMWRGVMVAYFIVALCYFPVAFVGYYVFGNAVDDNILITLSKPRWLIATANLFVVIHVIGSYQLKWKERENENTKDKITIHLTDPSRQIRDDALQMLETLSVRGWAEDDVENTSRYRASVVGSLPDSYQQFQFKLSAKLAKDHPELSESELLCEEIMQRQLDAAGEGQPLK